MINICDSNMQLAVLWPANVCTCCSRTAVRILKPPVSCNLVAVTGTHALLLQSLASSSTYGVRLALRIHARAGNEASCLGTVMLASNHGERAVGRTLRTPLRTFVRMLLHIYVNSNLLHPGNTTFCYTASALSPVLPLSQDVLRSCEFAFP
jgi:hypothetical protein